MLLSRVASFPYRWSPIGQNLDAPNPYIIAPYQATPGLVSTCVRPDVESYEGPHQEGLILTDWGGNPAFKDIGRNFDLRDNVYLEAVRINCPFADGLLTDDARSEIRVYGIRGTFDVVAAPMDVPAKPNLFIDLSGPWGEWHDVGRFIDFADHTNPQAYNFKSVVVLPYGLRVETISLDPAWNGRNPKIEIDLKMRYNYPRIG